MSTSGFPKTGGLLLKAFEEGKTDAITWIDVKVGNLVITVASDAMKATVDGRSGVRLPVSYDETVTICRAMDCVAPTQAMCDAIFAQAKPETSLVALVRTAADSLKMGSVEFTLRFHDGVEKQLAALGHVPGNLVAGAWKYWILHRRIVERGAVNYGFWDKSRKPPRPVQTVGGRHDALHYDYSQLLQPVKRYARDEKTGASVDLLEYIAKNDGVPQRYLGVFDKGAAVDKTIEPQVAVASFAETTVDLAKELESAGVNVVPTEGWEKRGRPGFAPVGVMVHHTAGPKKGDAPLLELVKNGRPDLSGPLCHIYLSRSGTAYVIGANRANHAGMGAKEVLDLVRSDQEVTGNARDHKYKDSIGGNQYFYGIEVENSGTNGDPYPSAQIDALVRICAALCQAHAWSPRRIVHHRQWTARKIDMSYRGDLPGMVAQHMDAAAIQFGEGYDPAEPLWESESPSNGPGDKTEVEPIQSTT